jgi:hypothetical protein
MRGCAGRVHLNCLIRGLCTSSGNSVCLGSSIHDVSIKLVMALARAGLNSRQLKGNWSAGGASGHTRCAVSTGSGFVGSH